MSLTNNNNNNINIKIQHKIIKYVVDIKNYYNK